MKTATIPTIRVEPEFRDQLESVLDEGETLSAFVEKALRECLHRRQTQAEFVKRGIAAMDRYKSEGGRTYSIDEVAAELRAMTAAAKASTARRQR